MQRALKTDAYFVKYVSCWNTHVFLVLSKQDCITDDWKIVPTVQIEPGSLKQHLEHMSYYVGVLTVMVIVK